MFFFAKHIYVQMQNGFYIIHYSIHVFTQKFQMSSGKVEEKKTIHTRVTQKTGQVCTIIIYGLSFLANIYSY